MTDVFQAINKVSNDIINFLMTVVILCITADTPLLVLCNTPNQWCELIQEIILQLTMVAISFKESSNRVEKFIFLYLMISYFICNQRIISGVF